VRNETETGGQHQKLDVMLRNHSPEMVEQLQSDVPAAPDATDDSDLERLRAKDPQGFEAAETLMRLSRGQ
jgi:hypothetical protein